MDNGRLVKELREIETDKRSGVKVELVDGKLNHMTGTINGASSRARGRTRV
jgi:ubiquitin-protein ligase